jgi:hypothetical protein
VFEKQRGWPHDLDVPVTYGACRPWSHVCTSQCSRLGHSAKKCSRINCNLRPYIRAMRWSHAAIYHCISSGLECRGAGAFARAEVSRIFSSSKTKHAVHAERLMTAGQGQCGLHMWCVLRCHLNDDAAQSRCVHPAARRRRGSCSSPSGRIFMCTLIGGLLGAASSPLVVTSRPRFEID